MNLRLTHILACASIVIAVAGCQSDSVHSDRPETVSENRSIISRVVDYKTSDPNLEPTLNVGGFLDVRTTHGGPVVLQSQIEKQRNAAEQQRIQNESNSAPIVVPNDAR